MSKSEERQGHFTSYLQILDGNKLFRHFIASLKIDLRDFDIYEIIINNEDLILHDKNWNCF